MVYVSCAAFASRRCRPHAELIRAVRYDPRMLVHNGKRWRTAFCLTIFVGACGSPDAASPAATSCSQDTLCLRTIGTQPAPLMSGRLVVVWDPVNKSQGPLEVAFDVPFSGT